MYKYKAQLNIYEQVQRVLY